MEPARKSPVSKYRAGISLRVSRIDTHLSAPMFGGTTNDRQIGVKTTEGNVHGRRIDRGFDRHDAGVGRGGNDRRLG